jgi:hypothetical protein
MQDDVIKLSVEYLRNRFNLIGRFKESVESLYGKEAAASIDESNIQDIDISTLLDYMTSFNVSGLKCNVCGKVHDTTINSLAMGFILMREAMKRR